MSKITGPKLKYSVGDMEAIRANEVVIQTNPHETIFSFFVAELPIILGTQAEQDAQIKAIKTVEAKCVARVVVPTSKIVEFSRINKMLPFAG